MANTHVTHRQRVQRDERIRKAFLAGIPASAIARRRGKSTRWVYKRLEAMGSPASLVPRDKCCRLPNEPQAATPS